MAVPIGDLVVQADVMVVGAGLALVALALRLVIHAGTTPSGVDTWYYLASADAFRRTRRFPISLPQYLLQDRTESYAPGFPLLLALLPSAFLRKRFWLISPIIDALHLLLLYAVVYRLTEDIVTAAVAGAIYAVVPQLIAETRSLNPRALGSLLASVSMLTLLRFTLPDDVAASLRLGGSPALVAVLAVLAIAALLLTASTSGIALGVAAVALTIVYGDPRYILFLVGGAITAFVVTRGFYASVLMNHAHAVRFWVRNVRFRGAEQVMDSPLYGVSGRRTVRRTRWRSLPWQFVRLVGENPFVIPMILTPLPSSEWWGEHMYWWAIAVLVWAFLTTAVPPLRVLGPGYIYLKASIFPTAFSLALAIGPRGLALPFIPLVLGAAVMSLAAIAFFVVYTRTRTTERTSSAPPELEKMAASLPALPLDGLLVLPAMYADYVCYHSGKRTLWGGHSGDLTRFEAIFPVIRRPLEELIAQYDLHYVLLDLSYVTPERLRLDRSLEEIQREGAFVLYRTRRAATG
ncbi:MAG: hypothetical protein KGJ98_07185 [Chloroflexota bacterium]|nr:hypothetical protein [Chloroflexota bacterium]